MRRHPSTHAQHGGQDDLVGRRRRAFQRGDIGLDLPPAPARQPPVPARPAQPRVDCLFSGDETVLARGSPPQGVVIHAMGVCVSRRRPEPNWAWIVQNSGRITPRTPERRGRARWGRRRGGTRAPTPRSRRGTPGTRSPGAAPRPAPPASPPGPGRCRGRPPPIVAASGAAGASASDPARSRNAGRSNSGWPIPQSPQSSSTGPPCDQRTLPGWKSPWTSPSGRPHSASAANRAGRPSTSRRSTARCGGRGVAPHHVGRPIDEGADSPVVPARGPAARPTAAPSPPAGRPGRRPSPPAARPWPPSSPHRARRPAGTRPRSPATSAGTGAPAAPSRPITSGSWAKNGGTCFSHTGPPAVGRRQIDERFHVFTCTGASVKATKPRRPRQVGGRAAGPGVGQAQGVVGQSRRPTTRATATGRRRSARPGR